MNINFRYKYKHIFMCIHFDIQANREWICTCIFFKNQITWILQAKKNAGLNAYKNNLILLLSILFFGKKTIECELPANMTMQYI